ncbi:hypothetical protein ACNKHU_21635 [Shigella flexneri]
MLGRADITPHYVACYLGHRNLCLSNWPCCHSCRSTRNTFSTKEHWLWCYWVIFLG